MKHTLNVSFQLKKGKANRKGLVPVYVRVTLDGRRFELSTSRNIAPEKWNGNLGLPLGNDEETTILRNYLTAFRMDILRQYNIMESLNKFITIETLKEKIRGTGEKGHSLLEVFDFHNQEMKNQVGIDISPRTYGKYLTTRQKLRTFIKTKYNCSDILLEELNYGFITSFEMFLKTKEKLSHNTVMKYLVRLKKVINIARSNEWLDKDPFRNYHVKMKKIERGYLTKEELTALETKKLTIPRVGKVRDVFVFCCYTGLAWSDVYRLAPDDIQTGIDGGKWIIIHRKKTGNRSPIPLLPQAEAIIEKYKNDPETQARGQLLPVNSNQRMNSYLKEIADLCGIKKNLTMHLARHTFATTVTLANGVPIETVSKMLGHTSIKTTQIYSKVVDTKISHDMQMLRQKLEPDGDLGKCQAV